MYKGDGVDVRNLDEDSAGCCGCLKREIDAENDLDAFVYCDKCMLAYHYKCEGFEKVPEDVGSLKFICKRCKEYVYILICYLYEISFQIILKKKI